VSGWQVGDRAYCKIVPWVKGTGLVLGRTYAVREVIEVRGEQGLKLDGALVPAPFIAFSTHRFHRIPKGQTFHQSGGKVL